MSTISWSNGAVDGGLGQVGGKDVVDIDEYKVVLEGTVLVCLGEIMRVMDRLRLRRSTPLQRRMA